MRIPDWIPDDVYLSGLDEGKGFNFFFGVLSDGGAHAAALSCECHFCRDGILFGVRDFFK